MSFTVSNHALEKHLLYSEKFEGASVFKNKDTMMSSIRACIDQPDCSSKYDERIRLEKRFNFTIGFKGYGNGQSYRIKVVGRKTRTHWTVITAYPIW